MKPILEALRAGWAAVKKHPSWGSCLEVSTIIAIVGVAISAAAAGYGAAASRQQAKRQAKAAESNAEAARAAGDATAARERRRHLAALESFGSRAGKAGVETRTGSVLETELQYASDMELEAQYARYGYQLEERQKTYEAYLHTKEAAGYNPYLSAGLVAAQQGTSIAGGYIRTTPPASTTGGGGGSTGYSLFSNPSWYELK